MDFADLSIICNSGDCDIFLVVFVDGELLQMSRLEENDVFAVSLACIIMAPIPGKCNVCLTVMPHVVQMRFCVSFCSASRVRNASPTFPILNLMLIFSENVTFYHLSQF